jgi:diaminohydroxyphosphoribosylaminopyrimidine deaminase/5-amino-6-(5-phosphoribosylamino)uracil reductase
MTDIDYIRLALDLAQQGRGLVSPNPLVGSVIVRDGKVVGRGYHRYDEWKHAEIWALEEAGSLARGATVYVNLEPCSHRGSGKRTPPCVQALINAGVRRVVASTVDPNPQVDGRGFELLREAGIEVETGLLDTEARRLNEVFFKSVTRGLPFVHLKVASSLDGRIASRTGDSRWVTGAAARAAGHDLRHSYDAILVGIGTVLADNPLLTDRSGHLRRLPLTRVVLDSRLRLPIGSRLVSSIDEGPVIVLTTPPTADGPSLARWEDQRKELESRGVQVWPIEPAEGMGQPRPCLSSALRALATISVTSLLVEGGATVAAGLLEALLVDKVTFFLAPMIIGGREAVPAIAGTGVSRLRDACRLRDLTLRNRDQDLELTGYPVYALAESPESRVSEVEMRCDQSGDMARIF